MRRIVYKDSCKVYTAYGEHDIRRPRCWESLVLMACHLESVARSTAEETARILWSMLTASLTWIRRASLIVMWWFSLIKQMTSHHFEGSTCGSHSNGCTYDITHQTVFHKEAQFQQFCRNRCGLFIFKFIFFIISLYLILANILTLIVYFEITVVVSGVNLSLKNLWMQFPERSLWFC